MGQRILKVSGELLRQVLRLPDDCQVVAISQYLFFDEDAFAVKVESPEFPAVPPGCHITNVLPVYQTKLEGGKFIGGELVGWNGLGGVTGDSYDAMVVESNLAALRAEPVAAKVGVVEDGTYAEAAARLGKPTPQEVAGAEMGKLTNGLVAGIDFGLPEPAVLMLRPGADQTAEMQAMLQARQAHLDKKGLATLPPDDPGGSTPFVVPDEPTHASLRYRTAGAAMETVQKHRERVGPEMPASLWLYLQSDLIDTIRERVAAEWAGATVELQPVPDVGMPSDCLWAKVTIPAVRRGREFF